MSERTGADMISRRRMLGILGAGVAFGMGTPAAVLTTSDAEAQTPSVDQRQNQPQDQRTVGTERRQDQRTDATEQDRRTNRTRRRTARRNARRERAMARQEARNKRRMARRTGSAGKSAKGPGAKGTGTTGTGTGTTGQAPARQ